LKSEEFGALNRRKEFRELALLALKEIEPLSLEAQRLVEQLANLVLIRLVTEHQLRSQTTPDFPLARNELASSAFELLIR
jgi:hypothetical protein